MPPTISPEILEFIAKKDEMLNKKAGWRTNDLIQYANRLIDYGTVEVGWRESCGSTDFTALTHREWIKIVARLRKQGLTITEETVKHNNSYATLSNGFWQSIIYQIDRLE